MSAVWIAVALVCTGAAAAASGMCCYRVWFLHPALTPFFTIVKFIFASMILAFIGVELDPYTGIDAVGLTVWVGLMSVVALDPL